MVDLKHLVELLGYDYRVSTRDYVSSEDSLRNHYRQGGASLSVMGRRPGRVIAITS